jgi:hypothetical protein
MVLVLLDGEKVSDSTFGLVESISLACFSKRSYFLPWGNEYPGGTNPLGERDGLL